MAFRVRSVKLELLMLTLLCIFLKSNARAINNNRAAVKYLQQFGYLEDSSYYRSGAASVEDDTVVNAIKDFQSFFGLTPTGVLDKDTMKKMDAPRCGVKDRNPGLTRRKRWDIEGSRWMLRRLTYRISKYPSWLKEPEVVDKEIARAFKVWSDVSDLSFEEKRYRRVNIDIRFESREHGDKNAFDGPGHVLAHANYPQFGGDVHFDDEEEWTIDEAAGKNLFQVAAHEFGHSLGLNHSRVNESLMLAVYRNYDPNFKLHEDDIAGIQELYGKTRRPLAPSSGSNGQPGEITAAENAPDICQDPVIDTIIYLPNYGTYVFKGDYCWKIEDKHIAKGYPRTIFREWDGLDGNLDASLTWSNGKAFFFKGDKYWRFSNKTMDAGYPKLISVGFEGIPDNIDAALLWSVNGKSYFFKGDQYWQYDYKADPPVSDKYPRLISNWKGIPNNLNAVFKWYDDTNYFFKGNEYYRFNDAAFEVASAKPPYPRPTAKWWFSC